MPYGLRKSGKGYKVITKTTGRAHSKKAMSLKKARAQLRVLNRAGK